MSESPRSTPDEIREELVSYLDGELAPEARQRVEELLATQPEVRAELTRLESTWKLLDNLPRVSLDDTFTRTTVEMIAVRAAAEVTQAPARRTWLWAAALVGGFLAATVGFWTIAQLVPDPNEQWQQDAPILAHLDSYLHAKDAAFLRSLIAADLFTEGDQVEPPRDTVDAASLPEEDAQHLLRAWNRFQSLPAAQQTQLRTLHGELDQDADRQDLWTVMQRYESWLASLSAAQRAGLASLGTAERVARIKTIQEEQTGPQENMLSPADRDTVRKWITNYLESFVAQLPQDARKQLDDVPKEGRLHTLFWMWAEQTARRNQIRWPRTPEIPEEQVAALMPQLSTEARARLAQAPPGPKRQMLIGRWVFQSISRRGFQWGPRMPKVSREELKAFFDKLTPDEREHLSAMPAEDMQRALRGMYLFKNFRPPEGMPHRGRLKEGRFKHDGRPRPGEEPPNGPFGLPLPPPDDAPPPHRTEPDE